MRATKIKICGLSRTEDIGAVNRALPDYIGFVFAKSRRQVDTGTAARLKGNLDPGIKAVGVFVNEEIDRIKEICGRGIIDLIQLHGEEDDAYIRRLKSGCGLPVIRAAGVGGRLPELSDMADYLLFDTASAQRGGTGTAFDWSVLNGYKERPYFLAGGLSAANVSGAIRLLHPFCVDISSGAETGGVKDAGKINEIVRLVRGIL